MKSTMIGLDIAKNVFQVHGVDAEGVVQVSKALQKALASRGAVQR